MKTEATKIKLPRIREIATESIKRAELYSGLRKKDGDEELISKSYSAGFMACYHYILNKTKSGHIRIENGELRFVYYELEKPRKDDYNIQLVGVVAGNIVENEGFRDRDYLKAMKEYEASKREVKVSNVFMKSKTEMILSTYPNLKLKNNHPCEAKIIDGKAIITKIT